MLSIMWVKDCKTKAQKEERLKKLQEVRWIFNLLEEKLQADINAVRKERLSKSNYELPAYSEKQAALNAQELALTELLTLINIPKGVDKS